ncbi:unnamed protein product, partial [Didymodactylos carnosus]
MLVSSTTTQQQESLRSAYMIIGKNSIYLPLNQSNIIQNLTNVYGIRDCGQQCLENDNCRTANYYKTGKVCSLFIEDSRRGQIALSTVADVLSLEQCVSGRSNICPQYAE